MFLVCVSSVCVCVCVCVCVRTSQVYDAETTSCTLSCPCPLTPGSHTSHKKDKTNKSAKSAVTSLTWLGFNDRGAVAVGDSAGMVQVRYEWWHSRVGCTCMIHSATQRAGTYCLHSHVA